MTEGKAKEGMWPANSVSMRRILDLALIAAVVFTAWRVWPVVFPPTRPTIPFALIPPPVRTGANLVDSSVLSAQAPLHVVLGVDPACPVCADSVELYRALSQDRGRSQGKWALQVLGDAGYQWLRGLGIDASVVPLPANLSVWATPSIMLVDNSGRITDLMVGFVDAKTEAHLWDRLDGVSTDPIDTAPAVEWLSRDQLQVTRGTNELPQLVDFRRRNSNVRPDPLARHIPLDELPERAPDELTVDRPVVLDCSVGRTTEAECLVAALSFRRAGFSKLALLPRR